MKRPLQATRGDLQATPLRPLVSNAMTPAPRVSAASAASTRTRVKTRDELLLFRVPLSDCRLIVFGLPKSATAHDLATIFRPLGLVYETAISKDSQVA